MTCMVSTERKLEGKLWEKLANHQQTTFFLAKRTLVFFIYIFGIGNPSGNVVHVYTSMCLTVCYTVHWDNSRILPGQAVGGRGQKSQ